MSELQVAGGDIGLYNYAECVGRERYRNCNYLRLPFQTSISNGGYGGGGSIGTASGIVRDILFKRADVSTPNFAMTYNRSLLLSYGPVLTHTHHALLVSHHFHHHGNDFRYWKAFTPSCFLVWMVLLFPLWIVTSRQLTNFTGGLSHNCFGVVLAISVLFFNAFFGGRLIETRSISVGKLPFSSLQDSASYVMNSQYRLIFETNGTLHENAIKTEPRYHALREALHKFPAMQVSLKQYSNLIANNKHYFSACADDFASSMTMMHKGSLMFVKDSKAGEILQSIAYDKDNRKFGRRITEAGLAVIETGHVTKLENQRPSSDADSVNETGE